MGGGRMIRDLLQSVRDWVTNQLPWSVANGGTGATTAAGARSNLGAVNKAGDTMTGNLTTTGLFVQYGSNKRAGIFSNSEGGNIWWEAPDGTHNEMDSYNNTHSRIYNNYQNVYHEVVWSRSKNYNLDNFQTTITASSGNGTRTSSARNDGWCNYYKWGRVVVCNFWCAANAQINTYSTSAALFTGLPANIWVGAMPAKMDNYTATVMVTVDTSGKFFISARETMIPAGNIVTGSYVYICS